MPYYGYYGFYGFDWTYLCLVLPCMIFALIASAKVKTTFNKYAKQFSRRNLTGQEAARQVLAAHGIYNVRIEQVAGKLTDHYDPKANVIRLSPEVYGSTSTAAIGVACHEAGHAVQYAQEYGPIKLRSAIIPVTNIGSKLAMPLILLGIILNFLGEVSYAFIYIGIICFALSLVFQLITLPVEFNASRRAIKTIENSQMLYEDEIKSAKKTLSAAAMTYVAATAVALAQVLRLIMIFGRRSRD